MGAITVGFNQRGVMSAGDEIFSYSCAEWNVEVSVSPMKP